MTAKSAEALFDLILKEHLKREGGYSECAEDLGKETYKGISRRFHPEWTGWPVIDRRRAEPGFPASLEEDRVLQEAVRQFYRLEVWQPLRFDELQSVPAVAEELFDAAAGPNGPAAAVKILQAALLFLGSNPGPIDGKMGPQTVKAAVSCNSPGDLVKLMNGLQLVHFLVGARHLDSVLSQAVGRLPLLRTFLRGWLRRVTLR